MVKDKDNYTVLLVQDKLYKISDHEQNYIPMRLRAMCDVIFTAPDCSLQKNRWCSSDDTVARFCLQWGSQATSTHWAQIQDELNISLWP